MQRKSKRVYQRLLLALIAAVLVGMTTTSTLWAQFQQAQVLRQHHLTRTNTIIHVLHRAEFLKLFGDNAEVLRDSKLLIDLAHKLYSAAGREEIREMCGEHIYGVLYAALSNEDISDEARDAVDKAASDATAMLSQTYTSGHFKFKYSTSDPNPDNNVTLADLQATATVMNNAWSNYTTNFTKPKHYTSGGQELIDVNVYYLGTSLYGSTASTINSIDLCSKKVVRNACLRQSVPVHELFHRVQYSYGYVTGTANMKWAVEGTASWSQKYLASNVGDYIGWWVNAGLAAPDVALITGRSYDACHFWIYLGERGNGEKQCIKLLWSTYQTNGKNMKSATETVIKTRVPNGSSFDQFAGWWDFANFYKDVSNAAADFDYTEDEWTRTCGGVTYGPLATVPRTTQALNVGTNYSTSGTVAAYGADYYVFNIGATVKKAEINVTAATKNYGYAIIQLKNNVMQTYQRTPAGGYDNYSFTKTLTPGQLTQIVLVVIGNPGGGNYSVSAKGSL